VQRRGPPSGPRRSGSRGRRGALGARCPSLPPSPASSCSPGSSSIALVGQHGPVVGPTEGGAEHAEELAVRKKERSLVEAVASDDHLLEADDVGRLGHKPMANDCHPLLEGLGHAPAVDGQHSQVSPHRAPPPLVSGERLTRAHRAFPEELRSDTGRSHYAEGVPGCDPCRCVTPARASTCGHSPLRAETSTKRRPPTVPDVLGNSRTEGARRA